jgi:hypothetical protein
MWGKHELGEIRRQMDTYGHTERARRYKSPSKNWSPGDSKVNFMSFLKTIMEDTDGYTDKRTDRRMDTQTARWFRKSPNKNYGETQTDTDTQQGDFISLLLFFLNKESSLEESDLRWSSIIPSPLLTNFGLFNDTSTTATVTQRQMTWVWHVSVRRCLCAL